MQESHRSCIHNMVFNTTDAELGNLVASVGGNQVSFASVGHLDLLRWIVVGYG